MKETLLETRPRDSIERSSSGVMLCTLASRILGFARESFFVAVLGVGAVGGALTFAFLIPNLFRRIFGEGAFTAVFLPLFTRTYEKEGKDKARGLVRAVSGGMLGFLTAITAAVILISFFYPRSEVSPQTGLTLDYLSIVFPYVVLVCAYAMAMAILNARGQFLLPALAPAVQNVVAIGGILLAGLLGFEGEGAGTWIAWVFLISGGVQLAIHFPALRREDMLVLPRIEEKNAQVGEIRREMLPLIFGLGLIQINVAVDQAIAVAFLHDGANQYLHLGNRLLQLPIGIIGIGTATVSFPLFARLFAAGTLTILGHELGRALRWIAYLALPAAVGMGVLAFPIAQVLFEHGEFQRHDTFYTAAVIGMYALAVPALCLVPITARMYYAAQNTRTPVRLSAILVVANIILSLILVQQIGAPGIALSTALVSWVNLIGLLLLAPKHSLPRPHLGLRYLVGLSLCSLACGLGARFTFQLGEALGSLPALIAAVTVGAGAWFLASFLLKMEEFRGLKKLFRRA